MLPLNLLDPLGEFAPANLQNPTDTYQRVEALKASMRAIRQRMIGRDRLLEQTLLALMTRRNQLIFSPPGTGKTLYSQLVFSQFADAQFFSIQLTAGTPEEALVGAIDLERLQRGLVWHDTAGSLVTADFAFLDELMDANDLVLRAILGILNERLFNKGRQMEQARLHTAIAATNFLRRSQMSQAILDRFIYKVYLAPEASALDQLRTDEVYGKYGSRVVDLGPPLSLNVLAEVSGVVRGENSEQVTAPSSVLFLKNQLIKEYVRRVNTRRKEQDPDSEELYVSPRTVSESRDALNAAALLAHRHDVRAEDLAVLCYVLPVVSVGGRANTDSQIIRENTLFFDVLHTISVTYSSNELELVEELMDISRYYEEFRTGNIVETSRDGSLLEFFRRGLRLVGLLSWEEATGDVFLRTLRNMNIVNRDVDELREALVAKVLADVRSSAR